MNGYVAVPTREGLDGVLDKLVLISEVADTMTLDRQFDELVLRVVSGAGNGADLQARTWFAYCEKLPYRREGILEKYRDWKAVVGLPCDDNPDGKVCGGDCDDLTIVLLAGLRTLGLSAMAEFGPQLTAVPEILADEAGDGFHVRVRVGLPPYAPTEWAILDPVWESEREWGMVDAEIAASPLLGGRGLPPGFSIVPIPAPPESSGMPSLLVLAAVGAIAYLVGRSRD